MMPDERERGKMVESFIILPSEQFDPLSSEQIATDILLSLFTPWVGDDAFVENVPDEVWKLIVGAWIIIEFVISEKCFVTV